MGKKSRKQPKAPPSAAPADELADDLAAVEVGDGMPARQMAEMGYTLLARGDGERGMRLLHAADEKGDAFASGRLGAVYAGLNLKGKPYERQRPCDPPLDPPRALAYRAEWPQVLDARRAASKRVLDARRAASTRVLDARRADR